MACTRTYAVLILTFIINIYSSESARILAVFPVPSISHQVVFRPIIHELAKRHEVVIITSDPAFPKGEAPANLTEIDVHDTSYNIWREMLYKLSMGSKNDLSTQIGNIVKAFSIIFEEQLKDEKVHHFINDKTQKFDLLILEACVRPVITLSHVFKAPVILMSSLGAVLDNNHVIGVPNHPLRYPAALRLKLYNLSLWDKFKELYYFFFIQSLIKEAEASDNQVLKKYFGSDLPTITELYNNVDMLFLNLNSIWAGNYPVPPGVIFLGGLHQTPQKKIPNDLEVYLNSSKHGVIYFSFGTNTKPSQQISQEKLKILIKVFSDLPYDVLWKYDEDKLPEKSENIRLFKWLPQADLIRHPNVKLFITQGGLQSSDEAITAGVPVLGIPLFVDQWYNVEQYVHHKIGLALDMETLTEDALKSAITNIIDDKSYRENIIKLRTLMTDQPQKPLERGIWWIEHLLRNGGAKHLRSPVANMSFTEFIEIDVIIAILIIFLIISSIIIMLSCLLWKSMKKNNVLNVKKKTS